MADIDEKTIDLFNLADESYRKCDYENALKYFKEYFAKNPEDALVCNMIGHLNKKIYGDDNIDEQINYFKKALELNPDFRAATRNLAFAYYRDARYFESLKVYEELLKQEPIADDYFAYACLKIMLGDFKEGWQYYEYRFKKSYGRTEYPQIDKPRWEGQKVADKTLLVHWEQGFGDTIHFFRYVKQLKPLVKKIIFRVQNEMVDLLKFNADGIEIVGASTPIEELQFDYHIPLMSLPFVLETSKENIPFSQGYIKADKNKIEEYRKKFFANDNFKIGICWNGFCAGNKSRDIPLSYFYPLADLDNVKIYSFQKDGYTNELKNLPQGVEIVDLGKTFKDFSDTAAAMANVDLFVTSDNSMLNLAGAMGKETCLLLNKDAEWRWFLDEETTPWYDSVKIFKKRSKTEGWDALMIRVIEKILNR